MDFRKESDSIGEREIPADALYGVQSLRALENFDITKNKMHLEFIRSLAKLKKACAMCNKDAGKLDAKKADAIVKACDMILDGKYLDQFIVDPLQGSAGTSMNMNANEVIANIANIILGTKPGDYSVVHPNDHVNFGQSTNDIIPSAGKITIYELLKVLDKKITALENALDKKSKEFDNVIKMGRTQLQDAVPVRLGQEFHAYKTAIERGHGRILESMKEMQVLNMGATAIGTGINADINYFNNICKVISKVTGIEMTQASDMIDATQHIDSFAAVSSALRNFAIAISKIANDLRLMSSGPRTGIGEINLPAMQNGSSIMPGKVNPVIPEVVSQVAFKIIGHDITIAMAAEGGQFELNAFEPVTFYTLFAGIEEMGNAIDTFIVHCIDGITANEKRCLDLLNSSVGTVTALCPHIGYKKSAELAKKSLKENIPLRKLIIDEGILTEDELNKILDPVKMTTPGIR